MEYFIKRFYSLGYDLKIVNNVIIISSLKDDTEIHLRTVENEVCIINFNMKYVTKFDIRLISLINSLLIEYSCNQIRIFLKKRCKC